MFPEPTHATEELRLVLLDDDPDLHLLLRTILGRASGVSIIPTSTDTASALATAVDEQPDVVLLDLNLAGDVSGADLVGPLVRLCPRTMVAAFSSLPAREHEDRLRRLGAFAYYPKDELATLPHVVRRDHQLFRRALAGDEVVAPAACVERAAC